MCSQDMTYSILTWLKQRWRLLFLLLVPLILLPLPLIYKTSVCLFRFHHRLSNSLFLGSKMWLCCTHPHPVLDHGSHSTTRYIFVAIDPFPHSRFRIFFELIIFYRFQFRLVFWSPKRRQGRISRI